MRKRLTKRAVDAAQPGSRPRFFWDTDVTGFGLKVTPPGRKIFVFQYRLRGLGRRAAPKRVTLGRYGELTPDQARKMAADLLLEVRAGNDPARTPRLADSPTVADLAKRFLAEHLPNKKRPPRGSTIGHYEILFRCHALPALGNKRVDAVTPADLEALHVSMRSSPYVANRTLALLQQAFTQAERWGWRPQHTNPATHIERFPEESRGAKKEVMLSAEQMRQLLEAIDIEELAFANTAACAAIRVAFWTGWRIGEVLRLQWNNLDLTTGRAKLVQTKTADVEYRQLPAEAVAVLESIPKVAGCPYVFPGRDLKLHLTTVKRPWERIRSRAGLDNLEGLGPLRLHDLRHNVVSWDVSCGVPLEIAGRNVGHRSRRSTEVYAHFAPDALKRAADERAEAMRKAIRDSDCPDDLPRIP